ncbi:hypothetical protein [Sporomusa ovata]|uniref:hypothetical protein n=1 Tax=Sporomusa ovata TaxID=2378 RepID=UPI0035B50DD7
MAPRQTADFAAGAPGNGFHCAFVVAVGNTAGVGPRQAADFACAANHTGVIAIYHNPVIQARKAADIARAVNRTAVVAIYYIAVIQAHQAADSGNTADSAGNVNIRYAAAIVIACQAADIRVISPTGDSYITKADTADSRILNIAEQTDCRCGRVVNHKSVDGVPGTV